MAPLTYTGIRKPLRVLSAVINDQGGSASDVRRLGDRVRAMVLERTGVDLRYEIVFAGDWSDWQEQP